MHYLSNICALCLIPTTHGKNISAQDSDGIIIEEKLKMFILELVNFKPDVRKYVCNICLQTINYIYKFRLKCLQNIISLSEYLEKLLSTHYENISVELIDIKQEQVENDQNDNESSQGIYESLPLENIVVKTEYDADDVQKINFTEEQNQINILKDDIKIGKDEQVAEGFSKDNTGVTETNIADNNSEVYANFKKFNEEKLLEGDLSSEEEITRSGYKCIECHKEFQTIPLLKRHRRSHTDERPYQCTLCEKKFKMPQHLKTHQRIHTGENPFECDLCHKKFKQISNLTNHKRTHSGDKPYQCHVCEYKCARVDILKIHMRSHTGETPYQCDICHKSFRYMNNLSSHKQIHTGVKPYHCHLCSYKSAQSSTLKEHMLTTHTEKKARKKPYECSRCEFKCKRARNLKQHMCTHTGDNSDLSTFVNIANLCGDGDDQSS